MKKTIWSERFWVGAPVRFAFTVVEVLVVVVLIGVLAGIALPALFSSKVNAIQMRCLSNMRNAHRVITLYSMDEQDALPFPGRTERFVSIPGPGTVRIGGDMGLSNGLWSAMFPDEWTEGEWNPGLRCAGQKRYDRSLPFWPQTDRSFEFPMFWMSAACWLDASTLRGGARSDEARPGLNRISSVAYPSKKVMVFEQDALCVFGPGADFWKFTAGQTFAYATSTGLMDGSVVRARQIDGVPAAWTMPFNSTVDGVYGRDLR